jgi:hypothetical protein
VTVLTDNGYVVLESAPGVGAWGQSPPLDLTSVVAGQKVLGGLLAGTTVELMQWIGGRWAILIEPLFQPPDGYDYRPKRSGGTVVSNPSEHAAGVAMDLNAMLHPMNSGLAGFTAAQIAAIRKLAASTNFDAKGALLEWGGEWDDGMHWQRAAGATDARVIQFLTNGDTVTPEQYAALMARLDALATLVDTDRARLDTLIHAQIAMDINQTLPYLQRIAKALNV